MELSRGLAALILILFFQHTVFASEFLYKDEVIHNPKFQESVDKLGGELYQKTGIRLSLIMLKNFNGYKNILAYEKDIAKDFKTPTILLTFAQDEKKVDIYANDSSLYNYFNREQVLSPAASPLQAVVIAITSSSSFDNFIAHLTNYGGTILPLIGLRTKKFEILGMYSAAMFNGYSDIAEQVAESKNVELENAAGNTNKNTISLIKLLFYGVIIYAILQYIRLKYIRGRRR